MYQQDYVNVSQLKKALNAIELKQDESNSNEATLIVYDHSKGKYKLIAPLDHANLLDHKYFDKKVSESTFYCDPNKSQSTVSKQNEHIQLQREAIKLNAKTFINHYY